MTQPETIAETVRELLRQEREANELTIREHAKLLGISEPTYFRIQRGRLDKTATALVRLALKSSSRQLPIAA